MRRHNDVSDCGNVEMITCLLQMLYDYMCYFFIFKDWQPVVDCGCNEYQGGAFYVDFSSDCHDFSDARQMSTSAAHALV